MPSGDTILKLRPIAALVSLLLLGSTSVRLLAGPETTKQIDQRLFQELRWRSIGPFRGGRVLAVTGVRGQPETYYFGAVGGGVWKTNDAGRTWKPIFDAQPVASIGAIAVAPSDVNVIFVGKTAGLTGRKCCSMTKTQAQLTWRSNQEIRRRYTPRCGRPAGHPGAYTHLRMGRAAACIVRPTAETIGRP